MTTNQWKKLSDRALIRMFKAVGLEVNTVEAAVAWAKAHGDSWYQEREWSKDQEDEFKRWLMKECKRLGLKKKVAEFQVGMFLLDIGWKVSE